MNRQVEIGGAPADMSQLMKDRKVRGYGPWNDAIRMLGERAFEVKWEGGLVLIANCSGEQLELESAPAADPLWSHGRPGEPWAVGWWLAK